MAMSGTEPTDDGSRDSERVISDFEHALWISHSAFERWVLKCLSSIGETRLTFVDSMVLHAVYHRARTTRLNDIAFVLNMDDSHVVAYSIRKLERLGLLMSTKRGKEKFFQTSKEGERLVKVYRGARERLLIGALEHFPGSEKEVAAAAEMLRALSGFYDQAARRAATAI